MLNKVTDKDLKRIRDKAYSFMGDIERKGGTILNVHMVKDINDNTKFDYFHITYSLNGKVKIKIIR